MSTVIVVGQDTATTTHSQCQDGMNHDLSISSVRPPYPYIAMMSSMQSNGMMSFLPPTDEGVAHEYSYTLTLDQSGNLYYLCTYPSHAQEGMYGRIIMTD